jgi:hypothetical protein
MRAVRDGSLSLRKEVRPLSTYEKLALIIAFAALMLKLVDTKRK